MAFPYPTNYSQYVVRPYRPCGLPQRPYTTPFTSYVAPEIPLAPGVQYPQAPLVPGVQYPQIPFTPGIPNIPYDLNRIPCRTCQERPRCNPCQQKPIYNPCRRNNQW